MKYYITRFLKLSLLFSFFISSAVFAANECKIKYGWNTGKTLNGTFKNHSKTIHLNKNQTKTINKKRLNYVKNLKTREVKFYINGVTNVTLKKNQRNPVVGTYVGTPKLVKAKCKNTSPASTAAPASPAALVQALKNQNVSIKNIALQLSSTFNKSKGDIVILLKGAGFNKNQIAGGLKSAFNASPVQILNALKKGFSNISRKSAASILKGLSFSINSIVGAIKTVQGGSVAQIAKAMMEAGYTSKTQVNQLYTSLKSKYNSADESVAKDVASSMISVGLSTKRIVEFMIQVTSLSAIKVATFMKQAGIPVKEVAQAIAQTGLSITVFVATEALKVAGWSSIQVMGAIKFVYKVNEKIMAKAFKMANYNANQTTQTLKSVYKLSRTRAKQALEYANFLVNQINVSLVKYYGQAQQAARNLQQGVGLAAPAVAAAASELQGWFIKAEIYKRKCKVNAVTAIAGPGVLGSSYRWKNLVREALKKSGMSSSVATQWDKAYKKAFIDWAKNVTIPSLPWYPAFAAYPTAGGNARLNKPMSKGSMVPPTPNVPSPLVTLVSRFTPGMAAPNLKKSILISLGNGANPTTKNAASAFATQIGGRFAKFLASAQVMTVLGSGRVNLAPGSVVGPVVGGTCWGKGILAANAMTF